MRLSNAILTEYRTSNGLPRYILKEQGFYVTRDNTDSESGIISEADGKTKNNILTLTGIMQRAEAVNQNNRWYSREILEREVENYRELIKKRTALGECDHPAEHVIEWKNVCLLVTDLWWKGNDLWGKVEILTEFPTGKILQAAYNANIPIGVSSRGLGSVTERGKKIIVNDDFQLVCWDAVVDPSTKGAYLGDKSIHETIERTISNNPLENLFRDILNKKG